MTIPRLIPVIFWRMITTGDLRKTNANGRTGYTVYNSHLITGNAIRVLPKPSFNLQISLQTAMIKLQQKEVGLWEKIIWVS